MSWFQAELHNFQNLLFTVMQNVNLLKQWSFLMKVRSKNWNLIQNQVMWGAADTVHPRVYQKDLYLGAYVYIYIFIYLPTQLLTNTEPHWVLSFKYLLLHWYLCLVCP
jgi:hypothetical protein